MTVPSREELGLPWDYPHEGCGAFLDPDEARFAITAANDHHELVEMLEAVLNSGGDCPQVNTEAWALLEKVK